MRSAIISAIAFFVFGLGEWNVHIGPTNSTYTGGAAVAVQPVRPGQFQTFTGSIQVAGTCSSCTGQVLVELCDFGTNKNQACDAGQIFATCVASCTAAAKTDMTCTAGAATVYPANDYVGIKIADAGCTTMPTYFVAGDFLE